MSEKYKPLHNGDWIVQTDEYWNGDAWIPVPVWNTRLYPLYGKEAGRINAKYRRPVVTNIPMAPIHGNESVEDRLKEAMLMLKERDDTLASIAYWLKVERLLPDERFPIANAWAIGVAGPTEVPHGEG